MNQKKKKTNNHINQKKVDSQKRLNNSLKKNANHTSDILATPDKLQRYKGTRN